MKQRQGYIIMMLCAGLLLTLCNCSDDSSDSMPQRTQELRLSLGYPSFRSTDGVTRTTLPTNFELYNYGSSLQPITQIQCYMTYEKDGQKFIPCQFDHVVIESATPAHVWTSQVPLYTLDPGNSYYLYGFMPKENVFVPNEDGSSGANIAPYVPSGGTATYTKGAVMTFTSLNTVIAADLCVIVGVQGFGKVPTSVSDMSSRLGCFDYDPETEGNSIFLLADHLYAGLKFNMKLEEDYASLRGITVKNIKLIPEDGENEVVETIDAEVTIANNAGQNPVSVVFKNPISGKSPQPAVLYNGEGKPLSTTPEEFMACVCPATNTNTKFMLETTYDVYDRKGNKIREDQKVRNAISLQYNLEAGKQHVLNITVKPTFLYVLSDPDLDDPTFVIN